MSKTCSVLDCGQIVYVKGFCSKHYARQRTRGTTDDGPRARNPLEKRFLKFFERRGPDECWPWIGKSVVDGYGVISVGGRGTEKILAHRFAYEITYGPIKDNHSYHGTVVRHSCDNSACVNPRHLELGTQKDNVRDMVERGHLVVPRLTGENHGYSRFSERDILYMRKSEKSNAELGREFNCARSVISGIRSRKTWKHLE